MNVKQVYTTLLTLLLLVPLHSSLPAAGTDLEINSKNLSGKLTRTLRTELSVTFSHDMTALGQERDGHRILKISPGTEGTFRWKGTRTLAFTPDKSWRWSTTYSVTVAKGLKALNGEILKYTESWTFQTPLAYPYLVTNERDDSFDRIKGFKGDSPPKPGNTNVWYKRWWINEALYLRFRQPVDPAGLAPFLEVKPAGTNKPVKMKATRYSENTVAITPVKPLLRNTVYRIRIKKGFKGKEGNTGTAQHFSFYVATEPPFYCTNSPRGTISVDEPNIRHYFSNPLAEDAIQKIRVYRVDENSNKTLPLSSESIKVSGRQSTIEIEIMEPLQVGDKLMVQMDRELKNLWGEPLTKNRQFIHTVCSSRNPYINFQMEKGKALLKAYSIQHMQYQMIQLNRGIEKHLSNHTKRGILMSNNGKPSFVE